MWMLASSDALYTNIKEYVFYDIDIVSLYCRQSAAQQEWWNEIKAYSPPMFQKYLKC